MLETLLLYASGTVIVVGILRYIYLHFQLPAPQELPKRGTPLAGLGIHARLRDFYRLAVSLEEDGRAFYLKLAAKAQDPATEKLCISLAAEEAVHKRKFQDQLDRWNELSPNPMEWPVLLEQVKKAGIFTDPPGDGASEEEMARYAISQEIKSAEFYSLFERSFPHAWKNAKMRVLVIEELEHEIKLRAAYPRVSV